MLSPGDYHLSVPRNLKANLEFRRHILMACKHDSSMRSAVKYACARDVLFYINAFVWQYNPRKKGEQGQKVGPFITWDFQDQAVREILWCIANDEDLLIEKSREMGASWLCLIVMEWCWHFGPWNKFLCISRSEKAVEDDDPDSLFWKIDFMHRHQPDWLLPRIKRRKLYFGNEDNGSTITGEASTGRAGVGGRATAMFIDEFSQIKEDYDVLHRTSDTTGCRIFNGTHCGTGTAFAELAHRVDMRKLVMHWTQHPDKKPGLYRYDAGRNKVEVLDTTYSYPSGFDYVLSEAPAGGPCPGLRSPWYDKECLRKGSPRAVAMDLDIDAGGSVAQFFNPLLIRALKSSYAVAPYWEGDLAYDRDSCKPTGLVRREGGPLRLWVHPRADGKLPPGRYGAGADISTGGGSTLSCFTAANRDTGEMVLEYATPYLAPEEFARVCVATCWLLASEENEPALLAWEHSGPGLKFAKEVLASGFRNVYYRESTGVKVGNRPDLNLPGWYPSLEQKRILLEDYRAALDGRLFINRSEESLNECLFFRYTTEGNVEHSGESNRSDPTGARVNHGDRTIAAALAWKMCKVKQGARAKAPDLAPPGSLAWRRSLVHNEQVGAW